MKVVILGAGQVGASVAEGLVSEENDITVVDYDGQRLAQLQDRLDLRTVVGNAATPSVLRNAGAADADMIIAVTQSDQANLVACKLAHSVFNVPTRIARLRSQDFLDDASLLSTDNFAVDFAHLPGTGDYRLHRAPDRVSRSVAGAQFRRVGGSAWSLCVPMRGACWSASRSSEMREHPAAGHGCADRRDLPRRPGRLARMAIRSSKPATRSFVLAATEHIRPVMRELRRMIKPVQRVMIAGGGNIGLRVAKSLEKRYEVKVIEVRKERAELLAGELNNALVLFGDGDGRGAAGTGEHRRDGSLPCR